MRWDDDYDDENGDYDDDDDHNDDHDHDHDDDDSLCKASCSHRKEPQTSWNQSQV